MRPALAAFLPAVLAALGSLGIPGLWGAPATLIHVASVLLVSSIGADYGVFLVEHRGSAEDRAITLSAIVVACVTTVLSFGLLAMSDNAA